MKLIDLIDRVIILLAELDKNKDNNLQKELDSTKLQLSEYNFEITDPIITQIQKINTEINNLNKIIKDDKVKGNELEQIKEHIINLKQFKTKVRMSIIKKDYVKFTMIPLSGIINKS